MTTLTNLDDEWNDGFALLRIILELLFVIAVLAQSPHCHLKHSSSSE